MDQLSSWLQGLKTAILENAFTACRHAQEVMAVSVYDSLTLVILVYVYTPFTMMIVIPNPPTPHSITAVTASDVTVQTVYEGGLMTSGAVLIAIYCSVPL